MPITLVTPPAVRFLSRLSPSPLYQSPLYPSPVSAFSSPEGPSPRTVFAGGGGGGVRVSEEEFKVFL